MDLSDLESVVQCASDLKATYQRIDCLVCNAGVLVPDTRHELTKDGFEVNVGTNHLGHTLLIHSLVDILRGGR